MLLQFTIFHKSVHADLTWLYSELATDVLFQGGISVMCPLF